MPESWWIQITDRASSISTGQVKLIFPDQASAKLAWEALKPALQDSYFDATLGTQKPKTVVQSVCKETISGEGVKRLREMDHLERP